MKKKEKVVDLKITTDEVRGELKMRDVFYPCDYCGGYTKRVEAYTDRSVGLMFDIKDEGVHMECCMRCWKKVFDVVLGSSTGKVVKP